ncbi:MAG: sensor domain-containing diguanylate cyclase [Gammaproteobacteria bacterium]|nr:sensor domain-containing diguanylate cyclase [Gammaproteobacteria bacterium]
MPVALPANQSNHILQTLPVGIIVLEQNRVSWINNTLLNMLHVTEEQIIGKSKDELDELELQLLFSEQPTIYIPAIHGNSERWLQCDCKQNGDGRQINTYQDVTQLHHLERERGRLESIIVDATTNDAVTGLLNRRGVIQRLEPQIARCRRYETPLSVIMLNVQLNQGGTVTEIGEQALLELGQLIKDFVRWADMIGHENAGEFLIVLPETELQGAKELAERLLAVVEQTTLSGMPEKSQLEVKLGVSAWRKNDNMAELIQRTNGALEDAVNNANNIAVS